MKKLGTSYRSPQALDVSPLLADVQARMPISADDYERLKNDIETNGVRDPLKIYTDRATGRDLIICGYNRWRIALECGLETVPVELYEGTDDELTDFAIDENLNRRHFTPKEKRQLIAYLVARHPERSSRAIAARVRVDHKTVTRIKKELREVGKIPRTTTVIGIDNRPRAIKKPKKQAKTGADVVILDAKTREYLKRYVHKLPAKVRKKAIDRLIRYLEELRARYER